MPVPIPHAMNFHAKQYGKNHKPINPLFATAEEAVAYGKRFNCEVFPLSIDRNPGWVDSCWNKLLRAKENVGRSFPAETNQSKNA